MGTSALYARTSHSSHEEFGFTSDGGRAGEAPDDPATTHPAADVPTADDAAAAHAEAAVDHCKIVADGRLEHVVAHPTAASGQPTHGQLATSARRSAPPATAASNGGSGQIAS